MPCTERKGAGSSSSKREWNRWRAEKQPAETMETLSLHVQDVAENAIRAGARRVEIKIVESTRKDSLSIEISHDGPAYSALAQDEGRDSSTRAEAIRKTGIGIYKLTGAAKGSGGEWSVGLSPKGDTRIRATFQLSHSDRAPLGQVEDVFQALVAGYPEIECRLEHTTEDTTQTWDTAAAEDFGETRPPTRWKDGDNTRC